MKDVREATFNEYKKLFSNKSAICELILTNQISSTKNEKVIIQGVFANKGEIALEAKDDRDGIVFFTPIESCHIEDLIYVAGQLHAKNYESL